MSHFSENAGSHANFVLGFSSVCHLWMLEFRHFDRGENVMKRIVLLSVVALTMWMAAVCGSSAPAASQDPATPLPSGQDTQPPLTQSAPTQPPVSTQSPTPASGTEVDITLADNTIDSTLTTFQAGVPYTFVIKNAGAHFHNFVINPLISVTGNLDAALSQALLVVTRDQLSPGATVTVTYTFPDSAVGAQLEFSCLIPRHYEDGMRLAITVTK